MSYDSSKLFFSNSDHIHTTRIFNTLFDDRVRRKPERVPGRSADSLKVVGGLQQSRFVPRNPDRIVSLDKKRRHDRHQVKDTGMEKVLENDSKTSVGNSRVSNEQHLKSESNDPRKATKQVDFTPNDDLLTRVSKAETEVQANAILSNASTAEVVDAAKRRNAKSGTDKVTAELGDRIVPAAGEMRTSLAVDAKTMASSGRDITPLADPLVEVAQDDSVAAARAAVEAIMVASDFGTTSTDDIKQIEKIVVKKDEPKITKVLTDGVRQDVEKIISEIDAIKAKKAEPKSLEPIGLYLQRTQN